MNIKDLLQKKLQQNKIFLKIKKIKSHPSKKNLLLDFAPDFPVPPIFHHLTTYWMIKLTNTLH